MAPPSTLAMGRYRMLRRLGTGGMGEVYLATAEGPDGVQKQVAIKLVRDDLLSSSELTDLFVEEAKVAFVLTHPNVVHSYEMAQVDGHHFLVMEYVEGTNLADLLVRWREERGEPIPMGVSLYIGAQVARGLEYAHTLAGVEGHPLGIVHRDVSPGNVLISKDGQVKVADFGLAKSALRSVQSRAGVVKGKLAYMPPEQLAGEEVGVQGDLYALGATLYELLCGENPFGPLHEVDVGRRLERTVIPPLAERRSDLDPRVAELVHRCLAYRAEERPTSAREICRGLEQVAQGLGLSATDYDLAELISGEKEKPDQGPVGDAHPFDRVLGLELERVTEAGAVSTYAAVGAKKGSLSTALESADVSSPDRAGGAAGTAPEAGSTGILTEGARPLLRQPTVLVPLVVLVLAVGVLSIKLAGRSSTDAPSVPSAAPPPDMAAPPPRAKAPILRLATLRIEAQPAGATVRVGGEERGTSPLSINGLPAGQALRVQVQHPNHLPYDHQVTLESGVTLLLQPRLTPLTEPAPRPPKPARIPGAYGKISINSEPWSEVRIDGKKVGNTPLVGHRLRTGRHRVKLNSPGTGRGHAETVNIKKGRDHKISVTLK